jgi:membrane associated rhomboid family serine protease
MQYHDSNSFGSRFTTPAVRFLLIATVAVFLLQMMFDQATGGLFTRHFSLSPAGMQSLELWQPLTYIFLHTGFLHLILNMAGLFFFGPETERAIGTQRFMLLYLGGGILAGLGWLMISGTAVSFCLGASGAVFAILGAYAALFPERPVTLLVFFVIPVTLRARTLALGLGLFSLLAMISQPGQVAYAAHLVGGVLGYFYGRSLSGAATPRITFNPRQWWNDLRWRWHRRKFKVIRGSRQAWEEDAAESSAPPSAEEVDAVLAKISRSGMGSLTQRERDILTRASRRR